MSAHVGGAAAERVVNRVPELWCRLVRARVHAVEAGSASWSGMASTHISGCLRCQAEVARQRMVLRGLREMASAVEQTPRDLSRLPFGALAAFGGGRRSPSRAATAAVASLSAAALGAAYLAGRRLRAAG